MDGIRRNGTCQCHKQYTGAVCELCSDPYKYGAACNLSKSNHSKYEGCQWNQLYI